MLNAVSTHTAPQRGRCFVTFLATVVLLVTGAQAAVAQTGYAQVSTPENAKERASLHLHGGVFSPIDVNAPSPTVGLRLSRFVGSHLQAGVLTGWTFERKDKTQSLSTLPGTAPELLLARLDGQLVPLMGLLQVNFTDKHWLMPYFGVGAGYEWLMLKATDYQTQQTAETVYSHWGWEGWVGMGIRLDRALRVNGELYYNGASLEREIVDENDQAWKEVVNLDGAGARIGLDIIFR
jgi:outer membrane protein W